MKSEIIYDLLQFLSKINEVNSSIKLDFNYWKAHVIFLYTSTKNHQENF